MPRSPPGGTDAGWKGLTGNMSHKPQQRRFTLTMFQSLVSDEDMAGAVGALVKTAKDRMHRDHVRAIETLFAYTFGKPEDLQSRNATWTAAMELIAPVLAKFPDDVAAECKAALVEHGKRTGLLVGIEPGDSSGGTTSTPS